ncbi:MAG TPA: hypothetical protein VEI24_05045, partial [Nitrospiria bacterium]|nr:hypothetical protein [Nitrospiria bacterium]
PRHHGGHPVGAGRLSRIDPCLGSSRSSACVRVMHKGTTSPLRSGKPPARDSRRPSELAANERCES